MIRFPKIPELWMNTPVIVKLLSEGITEDGENEQLAEWVGKCVFVEKTKQVLTAERQLIEIQATALCTGDIFPTTNKLTNGVAIIRDVEYKVHVFARNRNPDGSVHSTYMELI